MEQKLRKMCLFAGIEGVTNHSLRATQMFEMGMLEKVIQERIGHRLLGALRTYERTNQDQRRAVSEVLSSVSKHASYQYQARSSAYSALTSSI